MAYQDEELDTYVDERPDSGRGTQRLLIIILSVGCLALAVSNVFLAMRVTQLRRAAAAPQPAVARPAEPPAPAETTGPVSAPAAEAPAPAPPPPAAAAAPPAKPESASTPIPAEDQTVGRRQVAERSPARRRQSGDSAVTSSTSPRPVPEPSRPSAEPAPRASERAQARAGAGEEARVSAATRPTEGIATTPASRERATASWMVQEYGRADAARRARAVADFYGANSQDGAYWRRVLAEIAARQ